MSSTTPTIIAATQPSANSLTRTFGASGTTILGGYITDEEYNTRLQGKTALYWYDVMRRSEESVRAALQLVKLPLLNQTNSLKGFEEKNSEADFRKDFLKRELFERNVDFDKLKREALTFCDFGFSVAEVTYELTTFSGRTLIGIKDIGFRKQTSIDKWEVSGGKPGITQQLTTTSHNGSSLAEIIRKKLIVWTNDQEGDNYEGVSLLRYAFKAWDMVDKIGLIHLIGLEKMAIPTPVISVPKGATVEDENAAVLAIQQYRSNERAFIKKPVGWELDKFDLSGQSVDQILPALQHYETKILLSVLGQFLMLGTNSAGGSRAVSEDHSKLFMQSEEAFGKTFIAALQKDLIQTLEDINYANIEDTGYTKIQASAVKEDDMLGLADFAQKLKSASMLTPTFDTENHLRKIAKLPELPEEYEADYEVKREMSMTLPDQQPTNDTTTKDTPITKDAKTKAAVREAVHARRKLIDTLIS